VLSTLRYRARVAHRIDIIGGSGSGTSTLGRAVAQRLGIGSFDCDDYFHGPSDPPFQNPRTAQARYELMTRDIHPTAEWVLSGGVAHWSPYPELDFTLVVLLLVPAEVRVARLERRERERFGERLKPGGDMHDDHVEFLTWAARYEIGDLPGKTLARHEAWLAEQTCSVLRLDGTQPLEELIEAVVRGADRVA